MVAGSRRRRSHGHPEPRTRSGRRRSDRRRPAWKRTRLESPPVALELAWKPGPSPSAWRFDARQALVPSPVYPKVGRSVSTSQQSGSQKRLLESIKRSVLAARLRAGGDQFREALVQCLELGPVVVNDVRVVRIARDEVLVVFLGRIERAQRDDLGDDRGREDFRRFKLPDVRQRLAALLGRRVENDGAVLRALVGPLPVQLG